MKSFPPLPFSVVSSQETHLSQVAIGRSFVYKFKKPVCFPFVDYRSFAQRLFAASEEVLLNRRFSRGVYRGLALFTAEGTPASCSLLVPFHSNDVPAEAEEVAVVMRTLDMQRTARSLLTRGELSLEHHLRPLAHFLCQRLSALLVAADSAATLTRHLKHSLDNFSFLSTSTALTPFTSQCCAEALTLWQEHHRAGGDLHRLLEERLGRGALVEGHGDLRLEHVCFGSSPQDIDVFDCVEFSQDLRTGDLARDLAFLSMELDAHGEGRLARGFEQACQEELGDASFELAMPSFLSYRSLVRAKVHALRAAQLSENNTASSEDLQARTQHEKDLTCRHVALALRYEAGLRQPRLIVMNGLMGCGKSSIAQHLSHALGIELLASDYVRRMLLPKPSETSVTTGGAAYGTGNYSASTTQATYDMLLEYADQSLARGESFIADATFIDRRHRQQAIALAQKHHVPCCIISVTPPREVIIGRLRARSLQGTSLSEGREELLADQAARAEPLHADEKFDVVLSTQALDSPGEEALHLVRQLRSC